MGKLDDIDRQPCSGFTATFKLAQVGDWLRNRPKCALKGFVRGEQTSLGVREGNTYSRLFEERIKAFNYTLRLREHPSTGAEPPKSITEMIRPMAKTDNRRTQTTRKLQVEPEPSPPALDIRACAAAYAWFCGPFVIGLVLVCLFATHGKNPWESEVFVGGIILSLVISTARFRVLIDSASISYRAPFGGSRSFRFVEIKKAELIARSGKGQTYYRLVILPKTGTRSMVINLKYCSRSNVTELFNVLETGAGRKVVNRNLAPISRIAQ